MEDTWEPWVSAAVNSLQNLGLSREAALQELKNKRRPVNPNHATHVQFLSVCRGLPVGMLGAPEVMVRLAAGYVCLRGASLAAADGAATVQHGELAGVAPDETASTPLFEDFVHAALRPNALPPVRLSTLPTPTADGYAFAEGADNVAWLQARRALVLTARSSAALYGSLLWRDGYDTVDNQTVLVRHGSVKAAIESLRANPVVCMTVLRAACAYLSSVGLLYDTDSGTMCALVASTRPQWSGLYAWSSSERRLRTTRAMAAAELASAILTLPSPWRTWSRVVAGHVVRAWLERFAVPDTASIEDWPCHLPPFLARLKVGSALDVSHSWWSCGVKEPTVQAAVVSMWRATEWLSHGLAWSRAGLADDEAPWPIVGAPATAAPVVDLEYKGGRACPLCGATVIGGGGDADHDRGNSAYVVDANEPLMTRGGALGAWRMVWLEAHREAVGVAPTPLAAHDWTRAQAVVHQAVDVWIRHCLRPDANCVRAAASGGLGLRLVKQTDFMQTFAALVRPVVDTLAQ